MKDFHVGVALTKILGKAKTAHLLAGGLLLGASVFVSAPASAEDSLWGKAMGAIGIGGNGQQDQAAPAAPATAPTANAPAVQAKPTASSKAATPARAEAPAAAPQPVASAAPAPEPQQGSNMFSNWFGLGRGNSEASTSLPPVQVNAPAQQKAINPVQTAAPPPPPAAPRVGEPSMWDKMLGSVGVGNGGASMDSINYNERPKLTVPKDRNLPQPAPGADPAATRAANSDYLIKPPSDYLEKARGADGNVSGLRSSDVPNDKKFFGLF